MLATSMPAAELAVGEQVVTRRLANAAAVDHHTYFAEGVYVHNRNLGDAGEDVPPADFVSTMDAGTP